jgi:hypothetical protein
MNSNWVGYFVCQQVLRIIAKIFCDNRRKRGAGKRVASKADNEKRRVSAGMTDFMNLAALICAGVASTGFGLLAAYWVLRIGFSLMRPQPSRVAVKPELSVARSQ